MLYLQCETAGGRKELTRVAVVNEQRQCVYTTLVKPRNIITNYLTRFVFSPVVYICQLILMFQCANVRTFFGSVVPLHFVCEFAGVTAKR